MAAWGLGPEHFVRPSADVWPEHHYLVEILSFSPWRHGSMGGVIGLDVAQVKAIADLLSIPQDRWRKMMRDLLVIESEALPLMNG